MDIQRLCKIIDLQPEVTIQVLYHYENIDFGNLSPFFAELSSRQTWDQCYNNIINSLGDDPDGFKLLTCMLVNALHTHSVYVEKGISEDIFIATMKFFTRFINAHLVSYGTYRFAWGWWVARQLSCNEFRIGELEFETIDNNGCKSISIHIPSDAVMDTSILCKSYHDARSFFEKYYPEYKDADMYCDSWLLSPALEKLLQEPSNILNFQKAFTIERVDYESNNFMFWVYKRDNIPLEELPEGTSLQRRMKEYLLQGGKVGSASGKLNYASLCC
jgi:hypothetical protein